MAKSFFQLTPSEIQSANDRAWDSITITKERLTGPELGRLLGIRPMTEEEKGVIPAKFSHMSVPYVTMNNGSNRPLSVPGMKHLLKFFLDGRWALNGEVLIIDETGQAASMQHRAIAAFIASLLSDPTRTFPFLVVRGVPVELVDSIDTGKTRTAKDASIRHTDLLPADTLTELSGNAYGKTSAKVRETILGEVTSALRLLWLRSQSKDVNASSTGFKQDQYFEMLDRCPEILDLALLVYQYDTLSGKSGIINQRWGRAMVAAALVLASNIDNPAQQIGAKWEQPETYNVDLEFAKAFLSAAQNATGFCSPYYLKAKEYNTKNPLGKQYKMGALVKAIQWFASNQKATAISTPILDDEKNPTGRFVESIAYDAPPLPNHGIPSTPRTVDGKTGVWKWAHFGGLDVGYTVKEKAPSTDELADSDA